jgi:glutamate/tyrosine decarboxylase-like PLP-dependent enzyme
MNDDSGMISAWFAGPKAENAAWFSERLRQIVDDYYAWRRNYFPEDGVVVDSALRRHNEPFMDAFEDRLLELLARLKGDVPFHSPRYAAHMLAEQTLPGIAGYFAAMLYNPNNVTSEVAPVTVKLELEAGRLLSRMIGYDQNAWAHLCSGGTSANIEALWAARSTRYLPFIVRDIRRATHLDGAPSLASDAALLKMSPAAALEAYAQVWREINASPAAEQLAPAARDVMASSAYNVAERGVASVCAALGSSPVLIVPESHHYCFEKAMDVLGLGRRSLLSVRVDEHFRMRPDDLERTLDGVEAAGQHVLAVVAVVGSTEEGSIDPVDRIVALRDAREAAGLSSFWIHADGAYGGYLRTITIPSRSGLGDPTTQVKVADHIRQVRLELPEHGECAALEQMSRCDSVTIDPHKLGYIPYPAGAICFRSNLVKPLMRQVAPYLDEAPGDPEAERHTESIGLYVLEGSKPGASAAAVWLSHTLVPLDSSGHGRLMRENIRSACELHALLEQFPALVQGDSGSAPGMRAVCLCPPGSNIVCYAFRPDRPGVSLAELNRLNRELFERFNLSAGERVYEQSFFVSRTSLSIKQYSPDTVGRFLSRLGVSVEEYRDQGVFLLRSVMMNPWYTYAKRRGRYYISELVADLYRTAGELAAPGDRW